jgi:hypothetical protein
MEDEVQKEFIRIYKENKDIKWKWLNFQVLNNIDL